MKKLLKRWFKRLSVKSKRWFKNNPLNPKRELTKNETICLSICRKLISHPDSKFLIAPVSHKRYIKNENLGLFVVLDDTQVSITNHVYHYDVNLTFDEWDKLRKIYDAKTEKIRQDYESEIRSQIVHSLSTILEKVSKN
jgi:hypothetical protein